MWGGVTVVEKPAQKPVSVAQLKQWLRIDHSDDDQLLAPMLEGAIAKIDGPDGIGYAMMRQTWRKSMDAFPPCILLPGAPVKGIATVRYLDSAGVEQTLPEAAYRLDKDSEPARLVPAPGTTWPPTLRTIGAVKVDYRLGEEAAADVQPALVDAICLIVGHRFKHREAASDQTAESLPFGVEWILAAHSRCTVAA